MLQTCIWEVPGSSVDEAKGHFVLKLSWFSSFSQVICCKITLILLRPLSCSFQFIIYQSLCLSTLKSVSHGQRRQIKADWKVSDRWAKLFSACGFEGTCSSPELCNTHVGGGSSVAVRYPAPPTPPDRVEVTFPTNHRKGQFVSLYFRGLPNILQGETEYSSTEALQFDDFPRKYGTGLTY